jgi:hypothetical protein
MKKRKKKKIIIKQLTFSPGGRWPVGAACLPRAGVGGPAQCLGGRVSPLFRFTDGWDPIVSHAVFLMFVTEPDTTEAIGSRKPRDSSRNRLIPVLYRVT